MIAIGLGQPPTTMAAIRLLLPILLAAWTSGTASALDRLPGPYAAEVERIVDGDTLKVRIAVWIDQELSVAVRIRGVDAPELRGDCEAEREMARAATRALGRALGEGPAILTDIEGDKLFGRVIADVATAAGDDVGAALLAGGFVRRYDGGRRGGWCEPDMTGSLRGGSD